MNNQLHNEPMTAAEIEESELETIAATLQVRSGLKVGLSPCI